MKNLSLILFFIFSTNLGYAQKVHIIKLKPKEQIQIDFRNFYIEKVIDNRVDKSKLGWVNVDNSKTLHPALFRTDLENAFMVFFNEVLPDKKSFIPIKYKVLELKIWENDSVSPQIAGVKLSIEFYYEDLFLWNFNESIETTGTDATELHENNIKEILEKSIRSFYSSDWKIKTKLPFNEKGELHEPSYRVDDAPNDGKYRNRDVFAVGYQIGGVTLIGINYEKRLTDLFGLHLGFGLSGYTGGLKIHVGPKKNSPFFNLSYKDGGFGELRIAAIEFGGRIPLSRKHDFAIHAQIGMGSILHIDNSLALEIYNGPAPPATFTLGVGFSW